MTVTAPPNTITSNIFRTKKYIQYFSISSSCMLHFSNAHLHKPQTFEHVRLNYVSLMAIIMWTLEKMIKMIFVHHRWKLPVHQGLGAAMTATITHIYTYTRDRYFQYRIDR